MLNALTAEQARIAEQRTVAEEGVQLSDLMERAGEAVAAEVAGRMPTGRVVVLAGAGNNGGDGWVAARALHMAGRDVHVVSLLDPAGASGLAGDVAMAAIAAGVSFDVPDGELDPRDLGDVAVVVDALLGIGFAGPLRDPLPGWVSAANDSGAFVVAVDAPTGVDGDTGAVADEAIFADVTVTFTAPKRGLVLYPGAGYAGDVVVADVGVPDDLARFDDAPEVWALSEYAELLPLPAPDVHKYERGEVLVVAGSVAYAGAAVLAARGAQRAGAGYVRLAVPEPLVPLVHSACPSVVAHGLPVDASGAFSSDAASQAVSLAERADAVVLGPGMTLGEGARSVVRALVDTDAPLVVDADALNAFAGRGEELAARTAPTILTPHAGELARLVGRDADSLQADRISSARRLSGTSVTVVLKGAGTVISGEGRTVVNTSGTPALATAGTGDVLAGVLGGLLGQGLSPMEAGVLGAWLHGRAGEAAAESTSPISVIAEDIPHHLADAVAELLSVTEDTQH